MRLSPGDLEILLGLPDSFLGEDLSRLLLLDPYRLRGGGERLCEEAGDLDLDLDRDKERAGRCDRPGAGDLEMERDNDLVGERPLGRSGSLPPLPRPAGT